MSFIGVLKEASFLCDEYNKYKVINKFEPPGETNKFYLIIIFGFHLPSIHQPTENI